MALVMSDSPSKGTVILTGHYDVVDTADFGSLENLAFSPLEYTEALKRLSPGKEAEQDLKSGDYLFGRGVMDMKCGLAVEMALLAEASSSPSALGVNLLFLAVPDEEVGSAGMRAAVPMLSRLQDDKGLNFLGALLTEPGNAGAPGEEGEFIFLGAVGKLMPFFYCVGKGSPGELFRGFNASLWRPTYCCLWGEPRPSERSKGRPRLPCLSFHEGYPGRLFRDTSRQGCGFFQPADPGEDSGGSHPRDEKDSRRGLQRSVDQIRTSASEMGEDFDGREPEVLTFEEFASRTAAAVGGDVKGRIRDLVDAMDPTLDDRQRSLELVSEMLSWAPTSTPMIITGFLPPYYPHRMNRGESEGDLRAIRVAEKVIEAAKSRFGIDIRAREYFAGICDLSYMGFRGSSFDVLCMASNTPGWGSVYRLALKELLGLDIPVLTWALPGRIPTNLRRGFGCHIPGDIPELLREAVIPWVRFK